MEGGKLGLRDKPYIYCSYGKQAVSLQGSKVGQESLDFLSERKILFLLVKNPSLIASFPNG
jgi:hypothetical protein